MWRIGSFTWRQQHWCAILSMSSSPGYVDETIYEVPNTPPAHVESPTSFVDAYRRFEVIEMLKGSFAPGDVAHMAWNVGHYQKRPGNEDSEFIPVEAISLSPGENYVLFLDRRHWRRPD